MTQKKCAPKTHTYDAEYISCNTLVIVGIILISGQHQSNQPMLDFKTFDFDSQFLGIKISKLYGSSFSLSLGRLNCEEKFCFWTLSKRRMYKMNGIILVLVKKPTKKIIWRHTKTNAIQIEWVTDSESRNIIDSFVHFERYVVLVETIDVHNWISFASLNLDNREHQTLNCVITIDGNWVFFECFFLFTCTMNSSAVVAYHLN